MCTQKNKQRIRNIAFILVLLLIGTFILARFAEKKSYFDYIEEDVKMLGDFMQAEMTFATKYCSLENETPEDIEHTYILIGSVVLHRLEARLFGETIRDVIYSPGQYEVFLYQELMSNVNTPQEVYELAEHLLKYGPEGPEGLIYEMYFEFKDDAYWECGGIHFYVNERVTRKVKGGTVN